MRKLFKCLRKLYCWIHNILKPTIIKVKKYYYIGISLDDLGRYEEADLSFRKAKELENIDQ